MKRILLLAFMAIAMISCSDEKDDSPTSPSVSKSNFFPTSTGSYWIYDVQEESLIGTPSQDSVYIAGPITKLNRSGAIFKTINNATNETSEVYYSTEADKIYAFSNFTSTFSMQDFPVDQFFEEQWLMMIDTSDADWKIMKSDKIKRNINFGSMELEMEVEISADGERNSDTTYTVNDRNYKCQVYTIYVNADISTNFSGMPISMDFNIVQVLYLVEGIGIVEHYQKPFEFEMPFAGEQTIPGIRRKLLRYNIVK